MSIERDRLLDNSLHSIWILDYDSLIPVGELLGADKVLRGTQLRKFLSAKFLELDDATLIEVDQMLNTLELAKLARRGFKLTKF